MTTETKRGAFDWITAKELRAELKAKLGLNAKKVSCSTGSSNQYLTIWIRDASVDIKQVEEFVKQFNTWTMDMSDYVEGQSIYVKTTGEVDAIHAAPYINEIKDMIPKMIENQGIQLSTGAFLFCEQHEVYVCRDQKRGCYIRRYNVNEPYSIEALALQMSKI